MELLGAIEALGPVAALRASRWGYAGISAAHIGGLALLIGAILPLDLRLLGAWPAMRLDALEQVLRPVAGTGLILTLATGAMLFAVRATTYAGLPLFQLKMALVAAGVLNALLLLGTPLARLSRTRARITGIASLLVWPAVLVAGRFIAFL